MLSAHAIAATVTCMLFTVLFAPLPAAGQSSPQPPATEARQIWLDGYQALETAREAETREEFGAATEHYRQALSTFERVQQRFPEWQPSLIRYRIRFCRERISVLDKAAQKEREGLPRTKLLELLSKQRRQIHGFEEQKRELEQKLNLTSEALAAARSEAARNAAAAERVAALAEDVSNLEGELAAKETRISEAQKKIEELRQDTGRKAKIRKIEAKLQLAQAANAELQAMADSLQKDNSKLKTNLANAVESRQSLAARLEETTRQARTAELRLKERNREIAALTEENSRLEESADLLEKKLEVVEEQADRTKALQKQLRKLKKIEDKYEAAHERSAEAQEKLEQASAEIAATKEENIRLTEQLAAESKRTKVLVAENSELGKQLQIIAEARKRLLGDEGETDGAGEIGKELEQLLQSFSVERAAWNERKKEYQQQIERFRELSTKAGEQLRAADAKIRELERALAKQTANEDEIKARREIAAQLKGLSAKLQEKTDLAEKQQRVIDDLTDRLEQATKTQNRQKLELTAANQQINRLVKIADLLKDRESQLQNRLKALSDEGSQSGSALVDLTEKAEQQSRVIEALTEENRELTRRTSSQAEMLRKQEQQISRLEAKLEQASRGDVSETEPVTEADTAEKINKLRSDLESAYIEAEELRTQLAHYRANAAPDTASAAAAQSPAKGSTVSKNAARSLRKGIKAEHEQNIQTAIYHYNDTLKHDPEHKLALQRLGSIHMERQDYEAAAQYLRRAFKQDPDDLDTLLPLGHVLVRLGKADLAVSMLSRAVAIHPGNNVLHRNLGVACSSLGWRDAAKIQFLRALQIDSRDREAAFNMALLATTGDDPDLAKARKWYRLAVELGAEPDPGLEEVLQLQSDQRADDKTSE